MSEYDIDVLAFGAHPDDVELFAGGTVIRLVELGHRAGIVDLSRGEKASHGTVDERAREADAAAELMGLSFRENLGLPDTRIGEPEQLMKMVEVIRRRRPELILIPWLEERHPDHAAAGQLLTKAAYFAGVRNFETAPPTTRFVPRQVLYYPMREQTHPSFVVDTSSVVAKKAAAIMCHGSQMSRRRDPTLISSPRSLEAIEARDRWFGAQIGSAAAEPFRALNTLGLVDPLAHFRANVFPEAFIYEARR